MIYLDNAATTRQYDQVSRRMLELMDTGFGNPSALHHLGVEAEKAVKGARRALAATLGASEKEVVFTGGGTEADNMALMGAARGGRRRGMRILTTGVEHPAVLETCRALEQQGFQVEYLPVDPWGRVDLKALEEALGPEVAAVSIMQVNNELGTLEPVAEAGRLIKEKSRALFHVDAVQAYGKLPVEPALLQADLVSLSAHKIHGPKGVGALYLRQGTNLPPLLQGGGQEGGLRSGTENVPAIAGFGLAARMAAEGRRERLKAMEKAREHLLKGIKAEIPQAQINSPEPCAGPEDFSGGGPEPLCSPALLNVSFCGCRGEVLLHMLEEHGIYVATGAACSSRKKGSHVLAAAGLPPERAESALRFSFSEFNTPAEMEQVLARLKAAVESMRRIHRR
ncbi:MAG: cysteine desulfurase family protein [Bacillota bacterium]|nr:cysteine desulfurase family protein [Bacillota bacterium]